MSVTLQPGDVIMLVADTSMHGHLFRDINDAREWLQQKYIAEAGDEYGIEIGQPKRRHCDTCTCRLELRATRYAFFTAREFLKATTP